jgi:hypothetical protein
MTLGSAAGAGVRLIIWCRDCNHQVEPDPAEMAARYGAETTVIDWRGRLVCSRCSGQQIDMVVSGTKRGADSYRPHASRSHLSLVPGIVYRLPLQIGDGIGSATGERLNVVLPVAGASAASFACRRPRDALAGTPASVLSRCERA